MTLDDLERRIQGLRNVFLVPLLSQERVKLRTSSLASTFTSQGLSEHVSPLRE